MIIKRPWILQIPPEYNFAYVIRGENEFGHEESLLDEAAHGSYHVLLPDGRLQNIQYEADAGGYRPVITYVQPWQPQVIRKCVFSVTGLVWNLTNKRFWIMGDLYIT